MSDEDNDGKQLDDDSFDAQMGAQLDAQVEDKHVAEALEEEMEPEPALSEVELNEVIKSLCLSKVEEFKLLGYEYVSGEEIWECVSDRYRKTGNPALHEIVNDIMSLKSTKFMNWLTMSALKGAQF
ncbi:post-transcriptional regulator [Paenibacillus eucommiae]|uniref:Post-transcriptional regulator n=1 Tax=Paenibacillus eucommiae TaxID=1355755 RepID=A0ABS4JCG6_9BACL|nr:post-transcriptional regulator [Paenibacillus eucommiae]MBP1996761.1 hypothetical protein [Paenibacillus eucommiae]